MYDALTASAVHVGARLPAALKHAIELMCKLKVPTALECYDRDVLSHQVAYSVANALYCGGRGYYFARQTSGWHHPQEDAQEVLLALFNDLQRLKVPLQAFEVSSSNTVVLVYCCVGSLSSVVHA